MLIGEMLQCLKVWKIYLRYFHKIIRKESFGKLDYKYADIFLHHIFNYYLGKDVVLNNKKIAQIIQMDINDLDRPLILLDDTFIKLSQNKDLDIIEFVL